MSKEMMRAALRASSRATVRPAARPHSTDAERRYRAQLRQVEDMLGMHPCKKEGALGQFISCLGGLLGWGLGLMILFHMLSRV